MGIRFILNSRIDKAQLKELTGRSAAVFLACGAWQEKDAGIQGEEHLLSGEEFLRHSNLGQAALPGQKIGIIGAGNVAMDVARSLLRTGAEPVIIYRRTRAEMPALQEEAAKAEEEGIKMEWLTLPVKASPREGKIDLVCTRMELGPADESGRPRPVPVEGSEFTLEFDAVMKAIGEGVDTSFIPEEYLDAQGRLKIKAADYSLGCNLFAGGDFTSRPATVVEAIAAGRQAAGSIDGYLQGKGTAGERDGCGGNGEAERFNSDYLRKIPRSEAPELPAAERIQELNREEAGTLDSAAVQQEANRCFNCGCVAVNSSDTAPALIALGAVVRTTRREIEAEKFFTVGVDRTTVLEDDELVTEIEIPLPGNNTQAVFTKFALRKSIDFPVVNCAAVITAEGGTVREARICLNAVSNLPYRVREAEEYIKGKAIDESSAEAAAGAGLREAFPVVNNRYKIQVARTLVKRAILRCGNGCP